MHSIFESNTLFILFGMMFQVSEDMKLNFVKYYPKKNGFTKIELGDIRVKIPVILSDPDDLGKEPFLSLRDKCDGREVALCSDVMHSNGDIKHIPMLDGKKSLSESYQVIKKLALKTKMNFACFDSGNSFHLIVDRVLNELDFQKYLAVLILFGTENPEQEIIDLRWIAHRLKDSYMCLRITNFTGQFKKVPTFSKFITCE